MIKKLISVLLVMVMIISMLTGCSLNELGYLNLSKEVGNLTQFGFDNSTQIEITEQALGESYNVDLNLNGVVNIDELKSMYVSFDLMFKINDLGIEEPIRFIVADNKLYVSKNSLLGLITYENLLEGTSENDEIIKELYNNDLKYVEYILLADLSEINEISEITEMNSNFNYKDLSDDAANYLKTAFKGFDSKLITKVRSGYTIELTPEKALEFIERLVGYVSENKELVFDETVKYVEKVYISSEVEGVSAQEKEELVAELKESRQDFYDFIDEADIVMKSGELSYYEEMLKGSVIKEEILKDGNEYKQTFKAEIVIDNSLMGRISSSSKVTPKVVEKVSVTEESITLDELDELYKKVENKINPVQKMQLQWYAGSSNTQIDILRLNGNTSWNSQPYSLIEDRVYLPLRYIGESFGEEVQWDNENKKAYVVRNSEKINMTGVLINSKTMVKIRDFEKLGYKINYNQVDGISTAIIEK